MTNAQTNGRHSGWRIGSYEMRTMSKPTPRNNHCEQMCHQHPWPTEERLPNISMASTTLRIQSRAGGKKFYRSEPKDFGFNRDQLLLSRFIVE